MTSLPRPSEKSASRRSRILSRLLLVGIVGVGIPALILEFKRFTPFWAAPCAAIFGLWGVLLLIGGLRRRRRDGRGALAFNLGVLLLVLAAGELYLGVLSRTNARSVRRAEHGAYVIDDPVLGYKPMPGYRSRFTRMTEDETVYDVVYTIGKDGLRVRPQSEDPPPAASVLLFGCSYTFGSGLEDDETLPWQLGERLGKTHACYNFGFSGYGPHQMLANLESGRVQEIAQEPPTHAYCLIIEDHARRVIGESGFGRREPRFVRTRDGGVRREGLWQDDPRHLWSVRLKQLFHQSRIVDALDRKAASGRRDVGLLVAIVVSARDRIHEQWPGCSFRVLLWDDVPARVDPIESALVEAGIDLLRVSEILPGIRENPIPYRLHPLDQHPSADATQAIAEFLAPTIRQEYEERRR